MEKELFFEKIKNEVEVYFGDRASVKRHSVIKNNGLKREGLCVRINDCNCAPTVYLDDFYDAFTKGKPFDKIVSELCHLFEMYIVPEDVDLEFFKDFEKVREYVCFKLVSAERNEEELEDMPHRLVSNLAVTYFVSLDERGIEGSITIRNEHADFWGVSEEDLYEAAMDNTPRLFPAEIVPINKMMGEIMEKMGVDGSSFEDEWMPNDPGLYVATNTKRIKGAAIILYPGLLREVYESFGDSFYIIPASVNEVIFMKNTQMMDKDAIECIIRNVNDTCIDDEEFLSNNVYFYDGDGENNVKMLEEGSMAMVL